MLASGGWVGSALAAFVYLKLVEWIASTTTQPGIFGPLMVIGGIGLLLI